jgi:hypothetical protein
LILKERKMSLADVFSHPVPKCGFMDDEYGLRYSFNIYSFDEPFPRALNAVYAFVAPGGCVQYIGSTEDTSVRIPRHERLFEARRRGANALWIHVPGSPPDIQFREAERRLIQYYNPPMNELHKTALGPLGGFSDEVKSKLAPPFYGALSGLARRPSAARILLSDRGERDWP